MIKKLKNDKKIIKIPKLKENMRYVNFIIKFLLCLLNIVYHVYHVMFFTKYPSYNIVFHSIPFTVLLWFMYWKNLMMDNFVPSETKIY